MYGTCSSLASRLLGQPQLMALMAVVCSHHALEKILWLPRFCSSHRGAYSWYNCFSLAESKGHQHCGWIRPKAGRVGMFRVQGLGFRASTRARPDNKRQATAASSGRGRRHGARPGVKEGAGSHPAPSLSLAPRAVARRATRAIAY